MSSHPRTPRGSTREWKSVAYTFTCGDTTFTRRFAEKSAERRRQLADAYAAQMGYALTGSDETRGRQ